MGEQRSSSTDFSSLRSWVPLHSRGSLGRGRCNWQRGWCSFKASFQLQNSCQLSWAVPRPWGRLTGAKVRQLGASRPGKWQCLPPAYGGVCARAVPATVPLCARGTAGLGLFWQIFAVWELYFLWLSVFSLSLSLPTRGRLCQRVCKSVCK